MGKIKCAVVGPGNIGADLIEKIRKRSKNLEIGMVVGLYETSIGVQKAREYGIPVSLDGIQPLLDDPEIKIVFEATSASQHLKNAPLYKEYGKMTYDLTPAAVGPYAVPVCMSDRELDADNVNLITCGGQATIPIAYAISRVQKVKYAEIVSTISSKSAGAGTRANIDEFTETTAAGLRVVGGAERSKAIIILNPAEPPLMMRNTVYCVTEDEPDMEKIIESVHDIVSKIKEYVPGYQLLSGPYYDEVKQCIVMMIKVKGAGDSLPEYAGNLDIITSAATALADEWAGKYLKENENA
ncbi:MAG: acetaldehyde dehydrogenase (acetylating) [Erysipelotrichaceae bacterium]|nr:acetaldehyde dehydrogenase (acetylating) [Erysipelotrichaceae bacterium]